MKTLRYRVCPRRPENHLFEVECIIPAPNRAGQIFSLPTWIPGSYLIRDFSRHIVEIKAHTNGTSTRGTSTHGTPKRLHMLNKHTWQCEALDDATENQSALVLSYLVYAYDLTPRGAYIDNQQAFFNGSRVFMQIKGYENEPCEIEFIKPEDPKYHSWRIATSLPSSADNQAHYKFGIYQAKSYDDLIDHPVQMGNFAVTTFKTKTLSHELIITHTASKDLERLDIPRLTADLQKIAEHHIDFFGEAAAKERFLFFLTVFKGGQGGIEHKYACIAHASYEEMPKLNYLKQDVALSSAIYNPTNNSKSNTIPSTEPLAPYRNLLSLLSHEYFHAWHVKRIKPLAFIPYDLSQENYTRLLWLFEGITSYYDELSLIRSKLISVQSYLEALTVTINGVYTTPGRKNQTLEDSSFEAWIKLYKYDENSRNTTISYYSKGALVGLCLDLLLRRESKGKCSLDDIMRALWVQYGREEKGLPENGFELLVQQISGLNMTDFFNLALRSTEELPLEALLANVGIGVTWQLTKPLENLGGRLSNHNLSTVDLMEVLSDSPFERAGLAAKDQIVAINHHKVERHSIEAILAEYVSGEQLEIHAFRRDELMIFSVTVETQAAETADSKIATLQLLPKANLEQKRALEAWLKQSVS